MSAALQDGFTVLPAIFTQEEIASLRQAIADSTDRVARVMLTPFAASLPSAPIEERLERVAREDRAYASALLQVVMADAQRDPRMAAIATHPSLSESIVTLLAPEVPTGHVIRTRAAIPAFRARISPWHQDVPQPQSGTGCATVRVACWIPLSDVDEHSGALEVLPGAWDAPCPHEAGDDGHFGIPEEALPGVEPRVVPMRSGDVLLLDRHPPPRTADAWAAGTLVGGDVGEGGRPAILVLKHTWLPIVAVLTVAGAVALGPRGAMSSLMSLAGIPGYSFAALGGALLAIALVYAVARVTYGFSSSTLLLAGVAISFLFTSVILAIQYIGDVTTSFRIGRWLLGGLEVVGFLPVIHVLPFAVVGIAILLAISRDLDLLVVGEESAASRGVSVTTVKKLIFAAASLMVGGVVATCGPIGFVGLVVPHIGRLVLGPKHRTLAPFSVLAGGTFLVACDAVGRTVVAPIEIPVGIITALIGGPFFLAMLVQGHTRRRLRG